MDSSCTIIINLDEDEGKEDLYATCSGGRYDVMKASIGQEKSNEKILISTINSLRKFEKSNL